MYLVQTTNENTCAIKASVVKQNSGEANVLLRSSEREENTHKRDRLLQRKAFIRHSHVNHKRHISEMKNPTKKTQEATHIRYNLPCHCKNNREAPSLAVKSEIARFKKNAYRVVL